MKAKAQPTTPHTEQPTIEPVIKPTPKTIGQEISRYIVSDLTMNADQAMLDWLNSINAPDPVIALYTSVTMLLPLEQQLMDGKELTVMDGENLLDQIVEAGKALETVGGNIGDYKLEGTLPRYTLQVVETEAIRHNNSIMDEVTVSFSSPKTSEKTGSV